MWRSHAACRSGLQFTDCQPGQKMRAGGRPRPGGAAGEGCEKQTPGGGPQAPRPASLAHPGAPSGGGGAGGRRGERSAPGRSNGAAISRTQAQAARPGPQHRHRGDSKDAQARTRSQKAPGAGAQKGGPTGRQSPRGRSLAGPKPEGAARGGPGGATRCTRAKTRAQQGRPDREPAATRGRARRQTGLESARRGRKPAGRAERGSRGGRAAARARRRAAEAGPGPAKPRAGAPRRSGPAEGKGPRRKGGRGERKRRAGAAEGRRPGPQARTTTVRRERSDRERRAGEPPEWGTGAPARVPRTNGVVAAGSCDRGVISFMRRSLHCGAGAAAHGRSPFMEGPEARSST